MCIERCTTLKPFLFFRGQKHYARFSIPTKFRTLCNGQKFLVFALGAGDGHLIRLRASNIENHLVAKLQQGIPMELDRNKIKTYELDLNLGIAKADGPEDHDRLMEALKLLRSGRSPADSIEEVLRRFAEDRAGTPAPATVEKNSLTLNGLLDKYLLLKQLKPATVLAVKNTTKEFEKFLFGKIFIANILVSDVTRFQEFLAGTKKNTARTIDGKIGYLKTLLNFGIKQGYLLGKNPAEGKNLLTKRQKLSGGYLIFELDEIKNIFTSEYFNLQKEADPDYYYIILLGLITGCRVSELTSINKDQIKKSENNNWFFVIRDSKTDAGKREIPIPSLIFESGFQKFIDLKNGNEPIFKYISREGKGSGNAIGKKFSRHLELLKIQRGKLVFHSLRKFLNDYFMKNGVEFETRCQYIGHEIESVNVATYSKKFSIDQLFELVNPVQEKIIKLINLKKD